MPISVAWDNDEKTIIRLDYTEPVSSWQEYQDAVDEANNLAKGVGYPVASLHNGGSVNMPKGSPFPHIQRALRLAPPNVMLIVIIVENYFARAILPIIMRQSARQKIVFAPSLADAYRLIAEKMPQSRSSNGG